MYTLFLCSSFSWVKNEVSMRAYLLVLSVSDDGYDFLSRIFHYCPNSFASRKMVAVFLLAFCILTLLLTGYNVPGFFF